MSPRFQGENFQRNQTIVGKLTPIAKRLGISVGQLAIAWVAAQGEDIVPVVGIKTRKRLDEAVQAMSATIVPDDLDAIAQAVPRDAAQGTRYPQAAMAALDSER